MCNIVKAFFVKLWYKYAHIFTIVKVVIFTNKGVYNEPINSDH